jgi:transcriptional regulator with PAS, ATPase and Fis domain
MKKVALITLDEKPNEKYLRDLRSFFGDEIIFTGYSVNRSIDKIEKVDLVIISLPSLINIAKKYLKSDTEIIFFHRTFKKNSLDKLADIPENSKVALVNNTSTSAVDTISNLYELGIHHLELIPVSPELKNMPEYEYVITPGQTYHVPKSNKKIFDIGWRVLDVSIFMEIIMKLGIKSDKYDKKIESYINSIVPIRYGIQDVLRQSSQTKGELDTVLDTIDEGVMTVDKTDIIRHYNKAFFSILDMNVGDNEFIGRYIFDKNIPKEFYESVLKVEFIENKFINFKEKNNNIILTKRPIIVGKEECGFTVILKDRSEIENLEKQMRKELRESGYIAKYNFDNILGESQIINICKAKAKKMSKSGAPILIMGESGTGKEMFAQSIHNHSNRGNNPFLGINCATLSSNLLESELFGYEEGAFTGALKGGKKGLFELAHGGSIFLDEIGDMPLITQVKLLRVIQEKEIMRIGGSKIIPIDVRIIAATNIDLIGFMKNGNFRKDLYYRLNVFTLNVPSLRERNNDVGVLIKDMLVRFGGKNVALSPDLMRNLEKNNWEGNVRALRNALEYMVFMGSDYLTVDDLPYDLKYESKLKKSIIKDTEDKPMFAEMTTEENTLCEFILNMLNNKTCGRGMLLREAFKNGIDTSDYKIRNAIEELTNRGFVNSSIGRGGTSLTKEGKNIINRIK